MCSSARIRNLLVFLLISSVFGGSRKPAPERCEKGVRVTKGKPPSKFKIPLPIPNFNKCLWGLFAEGDCQVTLSCTVDMPESGDCGDNYVKVTDGSVASSTFCGKKEITNLKPTKGLRHLFLVVEYDSKAASGFQGISCSATCAKEIEGTAVDQTFERKLDQCVCGFQNKDDRIVGGEDAKEGEFPWQVAVVEPGTRQPTCGATVINDRFILTAAHCFWFDKKGPDAIEVLIHATLLDMTKTRGAKDVELGKEGSTRGSGHDKARKTDEDEKTQRYQIEEVINHPLFNKNYDYDYALLRIKGKIKLSNPDAPTPICLPPPTSFDDELKGYEGKMLTVIGWGLAAENAGASTRQLQKLDVPYIGWEKCKKSNPKIITERMFCAGFDKGEKDACTGDSGGPLVRKLENNQTRQLGIVSWGEGCARAGKPGVYAKIPEMMQWIDMHAMEQNTMWCRETK